MIGFISCDNLNDAARIYRLGRRIERATEKNETKLLNSDLQNDWGLSTILKIDTLINNELDYSVELMLPVDTARSIELTIQMLPNMIENFQDKEAIFSLHFIKTGKIIYEYRIKYIQIKNNKYEMEIINKIRQPNMRS